MPLDPSADPARRAWLDCPRCPLDVSCQACLEGKSCSQHWQYLIANQGTLLHLQCPDCAHLWEHDTRAA